MLFFKLWSRLKDFTLILIIALIINGCSDSYTSAESAYAVRVVGVNMKTKFHKSTLLVLTNKIAAFLDGTLKMRMQKVAPDSINTMAGPDEFYWRIAIRNENDSFGLDINCNYQRALVKRGELTPKKDAQAAFSEKALMHYLLTGEYIDRLICCRECKWLSKVRK